MKCPRCQAENKAGRKFCAACGQTLSDYRCPQCGFVNDAADQFCGGCGRALAVSAPAASSGTSSNLQPESPAEDKPAEVAGVGAVPAGHEVSDGERRHLTVMFCDLVNSTMLSERLDPEELREVMRGYQAAGTEVINRLGGHIARYIGDGLLVYFGYPRAHEDDPQRAVRAGLELAAMLPRLNARLQTRLELMRERPLQVRVGIHTGLVVVGEMGHGAYLDPTAIVGEAPNIAARLQALAAPDTVAISSATYKLVQGYFACESMGPQTLKGISGLVEVYRVLGESGAQSRFEVAVRSGLTPLVGREEEVALLRRCWERAKEGRGQVVLLSGEPGIGKSRLAQELTEQVARERYTRVEFRCSPFHQNTAYHPVIDHLQRLLELQVTDSPQEKLVKLERVLKQYGFPLQQAVPLFAALLSLPQPAGYPELTLTPQRQREKTQELLVVWLMMEAERRAFLAVWEDLHWADPSTLELFNLLVNQVPTSRMLALATARPEFVPQWGARSHCTQLTLGRLEHRQVEAMASEVVRGKTLPAEVMRQIVSKTDGVPLFVEELVKMVVESGMLKEGEREYELAGPLPSLAIPSTLHDSLMARLDRLSTVREVVQVAATLGREFTYELIRAVWTQDETGLHNSLAALVEAELLYQSGLVPHARYFFKHALIQETAYESLLRSRRQQLHQQVARVLEERFPETVETQPELLAHHYTAANLKEQAVAYWQRAGERSARRSANKEAVSQLSTGLELLKTLSNTPERVHQELTIQVLLSAPLAAIKGYAAPEVEKTYTRARELCQQLGETPQLFPVLSRLRAYYVVHGEIHTAREIGEQMLRLAGNAKDRDFLIEAHYSLATALFHLGEFASASEHFERTVALYDLEQHNSHAIIYGQDPGAASLSYDAWALAYLGYPNRALGKIDEAIALAQKLNHPLSLGFTRTLAAMLGQLRRDAQMTLDQADLAIEISREQGFAFWLALATMLRGWALAGLGNYEEGIATLRRGIAAYRATGAELGRPHFMAMLAEADGDAGQPEEGLRVLAEPLAAVQGNGNRNFEAAELHRLQGTLLLAVSAQDQKEAETNFHRAIEIARRQQAKFAELRAVTSLCRLWCGQGKIDSARRELSHICGWFTEGFDTGDFKAAKMLLSELG